MDQKTPREICAALAQPFAPEDLEWRIQQAYENSMRGIAVPYVTNRAIQTRLDDIVGPENWYNDYKPWHSANKKESQLCGIAIYFEGRGWITKWDGAEDSDIEPVKGGLSDSMKRAAVQWGIGRVLYSLDTVWVDVEKKGKSFVITDSSRPKLDKAYLDLLGKLKLTPAPPGGTQSQLTPTASQNVGTAQAHQSKAPATERQAQPSDTPSGSQSKYPSAIPNKESKKEAPEAAKTMEPSKSAGTPAGKSVEFPHKAETPSYEYIVESAQIQNGMTSRSTTVVLRAHDGKVTKAFARGAHTDLTPGTLLIHVKLTLKTQSSVAFYMLESYEVTAIEDAA